MNRARVWHHTVIISTGVLADVISSGADARTAGDDQDLELVKTRISKRFGLAADRQGQLRRDRTSWHSHGPATSVVSSHGQQSPPKSPDPAARLAHGLHALRSCRR